MSKRREGKESILREREKTREAPPPHPNQKRTKNNSQTSNLVLPLRLLVGRLHCLVKQPPCRRQARQGEQSQDRRVQRARRGQDAEDGVFVGELEDGADGGDGDEGRGDEEDGEGRAAGALACRPGGLFPLAADPGELVGVLLRRSGRRRRGRGRGRFLGWKVFFFFFLRKGGGGRGRKECLRN